MASLQGRHQLKPAPRDGHALGGHDYLADRPQRDAGEFYVGPGEGNADDGYGERDRGDDMSERQPPARQHKPDQVADQAQRSAADIGAAGEAVAAHGPLTERQ